MARGTTTAPGAFADVEALRACWHPVAFSHELADRPAHADLLGQPLVLWRGADRQVRACLDLCVHRGTALSLGWVNGDELVCPYHGWRYLADGRCAAIPQLEDPSRVPTKARIPVFRCQERYGLIWVALEEPRWSLPEVPEVENGNWACSGTTTVEPSSPNCDTSPVEPLSGVVPASVALSFFTANS
jgi:phenylpropionate dioxygenase-like ring-hydroxylating dioxygenase large terminal subunit